MARRRRRGLATVADLSAGDPENTLLRRGLGAFRGGLGRVRLERWDVAGSMAELGEARRIFEELVARDATNVDWRLQVGVCRSRTAAALVRRDPASAP